MSNRYFLEGILLVVAGFIISEFKMSPVVTVYKRLKI